MLPFLQGCSYQPWAFSKNISQDSQLLPCSDSPSVMYLEWGHRPPSRLHSLSSTHLTLWLFTWVSFLLNHIKSCLTSKPTWVFVRENSKSRWLS